MSVQHKAQALAITCIDYRFQEMINEDLKNRSLWGNVDRIAWPGASKDFENVKQAAMLSLKLHDPEKVIIYEHRDCGAYGENDLEETHRKSAYNLANSLREIKPKLEVIPLIATFEGIKEL